MFAGGLPEASVDLPWVARRRGREPVRSVHPAHLGDGPSIPSTVPGSRRWGALPGATEEESAYTHDNPPANIPRPVAGT